MSAPAGLGGTAADDATSDSRFMGVPARFWAGILLAAAAGCYVLAAGRLIDVPGLQYDEVLFVNAATGEPTNGIFVAKRLFGVPVMLMTYIGALKAYLYYPVFSLFGVSPATIRWPVIALSLGTLGLAYAVARFSCGRVTSALLTLAIAADPAFIYMTKLDYGPVVLMLLLKMLAVWCLLRAVRRESTGALWGVTAACALGMFDKLNFIWFVVALTVAAAILFRGELTRVYRRRRLAFVAPLASLAAVFLVTTVYLVGPQLLSSQTAAESVTLADRVPYVLRLYARTMNGRELFNFVTGRELVAVSLTNVVTVAGLVLAVVGCGYAVWRAGALARMEWRQRVLACHLLVFVVVGLEIWVTKKAWGPHHLMMLYPFQYLIVFAFVDRLAGAAGAAVLAAVLLASSASVGNAYRQAMRPAAEFQPQWSPRVYDLVAYLDARRLDRIVSVDWGIHNQLYALGSPSTRAAARDRWPQFRAADNRAAQMRVYRDVLGRRAVAILHGRGWDNMPEVRPHFFAWAASFGLAATLERTFSSPAGTPIFEVYSLSGAGLRPAAPE